MNKNLYIYKFKKKRQKLLILKIPCTYYIKIVLVHHLYCVFISLLSTKTHTSHNILPAMTRVSSVRLTLLILVLLSFSCALAIEDPSIINSSKSEDQHYDPRGDSSRYFHEAQSQLPNKPISKGSLHECPKMMRHECGEEIVDNMLHSGPKSLNIQCCHSLLQDGYDCHYRLVKKLFILYPNFKSMSSQIITEGMRVWNTCLYTVKG